MITAILILIIISGAAHSAPKTTKTHILCPQPECPGLIEHYRHLGWVRKKKKKTKKTEKKQPETDKTKQPLAIMEVIIA